MVETQTVDTQVFLAVQAAAEAAEAVRAIKRLVLAHLDKALLAALVMAAVKVIQVAVAVAHHKLVRLERPHMVDTAEQEPLGQMEQPMLVAVAQAQTRKMVAEVPLGQVAQEAVVLAVKTRLV